MKELQQLADDNPEIGRIQTEVNYLPKHSDAGRLRYTVFKTLGLPLDSGAIESSIRRVINMRLKDSGIFRREGNAESMLQLRALIISDRWDERVRLMRQSRRAARLPDRHRAPQ